MKKYRIALLVDEFFGAGGTAYGGYGFLARKFIAKYIPNDNIEMDVIIDKRNKGGFLSKYFVKKRRFAESCGFKS